MVPTQNCARQQNSCPLRSPNDESVAAHASTPEAAKLCSDPAGPGWRGAAGPRRPAAQVSSGANGVGSQGNEHHIRERVVDESVDVAGQAGRTGGDGARPDHPGADGRDRPDHLERDLRVRPAPVRGPRAVPHPGRHPRPRADGHRRGGRPRGHPHQGRRPGGRAVQHLLRLVLDVHPRPLRPVRDHPGPRAGQGRRAVRLHLPVRRRAGRAGRVPPGAAGPLRPDQGPGRAHRPALALPLRHPAHRLAGRGLRRRAARRNPRRPRAGPGRPVLRPDRPPPGRRARHRRRPGPRAHRDGARAGHRGARHERGRRRRGGPDRAHRRPRARTP